MADTSNKKRRKQPAPRTGRKSSSTTFYTWLNPQTEPATNSAELEILRDQKTSPIISGIQHGSPADRVLHLAAANSIMVDPTCRKLLLRAGLIKILLEQVLVDASQEVVCAGWGVLRKLGELEGYDVSVHLYRQGISKLIDGIIDNVCEELSC